MFVRLPSDASFGGRPGSPIISLAEMDLILHQLDANHFGPKLGPPRAQVLAAASQQVTFESAFEVLRWPHHIR